MGLVLITETADRRQYRVRRALPQPAERRSLDGLPQLLEQLEKALDDGNILYTIDELNYAINSNRKPVTIMITEEFNQRNQTNRRFQSVIQVSKNVGATVVVLKKTNPISPRLKELGGFVCVITH
jgi:stalled ribosome rescue protein Dom34